MTGVWIVVALGVILIIADWRMSTVVDPKTRRRSRLNVTDKKRLRDMVLWTISVAAAVWFLPQFF